MSLTLALMFREADLKWLILHLPVLKPAFSQIYAAGGETDGPAADYLRSQGAQVHHISFNDWNWSRFWNEFLTLLTLSGVQRVLRLDPDEVMFPEDIEAVDETLDSLSLIGLARVNFWYDRTRYDVNAFPDVQYRAWRMDGRIKYLRPVHECISFAGKSHEVGIFYNRLIFHYGNVGKNNIKERALRYINLDRAMHGLEPLSEIPADRQPGATILTYSPSQPIDPKVCGIYAPFEE